MVIDGHYGLILAGKKSNTELDIEIAKALDKIDELEKNKEITENKAKELRQEVENRKYFELFFDCSDMIGDPYSFTVPYKQEMLFELLPTDKISELQLYFYQSGMEQGKVTKTFYGIDNELIQQDQTENLFVENVSVHFGYSFDVYDDETAILYTLDSLTFEKNKDNSEIKPVKELQLRWVHHEDEQSYSITDIVHSSLKNHYVQVHWYRYDLQSDPNDKDPLAGYFWKEITDNINRFSLKIDLNPLWTKEKFKVVIEYDGRVIHSNVLEFTNPSGEVGTSSMITGLTINYPERDEYNGTFYIYGDDHFAGFSTERLFYLIADYVTLDGDNEYWENSDVICWKFPKINTMIHKPENGFEYDEENGDVFLEAGTTATATVNGIVFTADPEYHQVIRRIVINTEKDGSNRNSEESRTQGYRIFNQYIGTAIDNTIKCQVFKPTMNSIEAKISFTFGLHTTNGTKYTLAVDWTEIAHILDNNGNQQTIEYQRPPAITMHETYRWIFDVKILDSDQREIEAPEGGWPIKIGWHDNRIANPKESGDTISKIITYDSANKRITVNISKDDYNNYINFAQYQILKISIDTSKCDFDYALTTFIPLPIRARRDIVAIEGADRIYYDASGYNPK